MRSSDWSSDVCSSDLDIPDLSRKCNLLICDGGWTKDRISLERSSPGVVGHRVSILGGLQRRSFKLGDLCLINGSLNPTSLFLRQHPGRALNPIHDSAIINRFLDLGIGGRSEDHTSDLQSLIRTSSAVFSLNNNKQ